METAHERERNTYLTFGLGDEVFALDVGNVHEVLQAIPITRIPRTEAFMRGVINLRGRVLPVLDLRERFALPEAPTTSETCIVVLELELEEEALVIGAVVDS